MDNNFNENYNKKGFYTVLYTLAAVFVIIAFGISILNSGNDSPKNTVDMGDSAPVDKSNVAPLTTTTESTTETTTLNDNKITTTTTDKSLNIDAQSENGELSIFDDSQEMAWPVNGQIVMDYSTDTAIFDRTLEQYRTNSSICISSDVGTKVCAAADGIITSISKDNISGITVSVDHGNGWCSTYGQLGENLAVSEGEAVHKGDLIGTVANPTKYSSALGAHLEFSVLSDDVPTDPKLVLAQAE